MTKYVCFEEQVITSVLDYKPNVPHSVTVVEITDQQYVDVFEKRTHVVNQSGRVTSAPGSVIAAAKQQETNNKNLAFLSSTDWMVLRHVREKALGMQTSLTEDKYLELERQRQQAADEIQR